MDKTSEAYREHRRDICRRSQARRRTKFKSDGLCIQCGKFEPVKNKTLCPKCLAKQRAIQNRYYDRIRMKNDSEIR